MEFIIGDKKIIKGFTECERVLMKNEFADECKPTNGDPSGVQCAPTKTVDEGSDEYILNILLASRNRKMIGRDDTYICIPKHCYAAIVGELLHK